MHILMFGMSSYPGGIENYIYNYFIATDLPKSYKIDFITYEEMIAYEDEINKKLYNVYHVPNLKRNPISYYQCVKKIMKQKEYDCIYINMLTAANIIPIYLAVQNKIKCIVLHAHANSTIKGFFRKTLHYINKRYCKKNATLCLSCSLEAGNWLFDNRNFSVIPNAIDCSRFKFNMKYRTEIRNLLKIKEFEYVIGHVGRLAEEKNHFFMLEVLKEILNININVKLVFVGDGILRNNIKQRAQDLGLESHVLFYGSTSETYKFYSAFDSFLFPSKFEGFGMAALEAQSCGLSCYCSSQLSTMLNVTGTVKFIDLNLGPKVWAEIISNGINDKKSYLEMNRKVEKSSFNIKNEKVKLLRLLDEYR